MHLNFSVDFVKSQNMVYHLRKETWNELKDKILDFSSVFTLVLCAFSFFLAGLYCFFLITGQYVRKCLLRDTYVL